MRKPVSPVTKISDFATEISEIGLEIFRYKHSTLVTGTTNIVSLLQKVALMASFCLVSGVFFIRSMSLTAAVKFQVSTKLR